MKIQPLFYAHQPKLVNFKSQNKETENFPLTKYFSIDPNEVGVTSNQDIKISQDEKKILIEKILEAHMQARKNVLFGNITGKGYATNIGLKNGIWSCATNFNNTRNDISAVCGERSAVLGAYNALLSSKPYDADPSELDFKVKYVAMSSAKEIGTDKNASSPCAQCLSWFNTTRYFDDETIIASFKKDDEGKLNLHLAKLSEYLPIRNEINIAQDVSVADLPIFISPSAKESMSTKGIKKEEIQGLMQELEVNYKANTLTYPSKQNAVAAVLMEDEIFFAPKVDLSKRWNVDPIQYAATKAIEAKGRDKKIDLIAVFGDSTVFDKGFLHNNGVVNIKTLGALTAEYADKNALVVTSTDKAINIRTIDDYMPDEHRFIQAYKMQN